MRASRPPRGGGTPGPQLPKRLLRPFYRLEAERVFRQDKGGVYETLAREESAFSGALLPVNNEDLQYLPDGAATINSQKLYTNGETLRLGQQVRDSLDGQVYTVFQELTHSPLLGLRRYVITKKGAAGNGK